MEGFKSDRIVLMRLIKGFDVGIEVRGRLLDLETIGSWIAITISCPVYWYAGSIFSLAAVVAEIGQWSLLLVQAVVNGCPPWDASEVS